MEEYLKAISKTNNLIVNKLINDDEINRFSKSDIRWADNKNKEYQTRKVKKGEIYQFEFGKNMKPELILAGRCLICVRHGRMHRKKRRERQQERQEFYQQLMLGGMMKFPTK